MGWKGGRVWPLAAAVVIAAGILCWRAWRGSSASSELAAAEEAAEQRDFRRAADLLASYLDRNPDDLAARLNAARAARRAGDADRARRHLQGLDKSPEFRDAAMLERKLLDIAVGDLRHCRSLLVQCLRHRDAPEAPLVAEAVLGAMIGRFVPTYTVEVRALRDPGLPDGPSLREAADYWLGKQTSSAGRVQGLLWRAQANRLVDEHTAAVADLRQALHLDPGNSNVRIVLALTIAPESPEEAIRHLERARQAQPDDERLAYALATLFRSTGRLREARQLLDRLLTASPRRPEIALERGLVALDENRPVEAEPHLRQALALDPESRDANLAMGRCLQMAGRPKDAQPFLDKCSELDARSAKSE